MLLLKGVHHIRTGRNLKGCQDLARAPGRGRPRAAPGLAREAARLAARQEYRLWLEEQWKLHFVRAAGPCRVLPPQARARLGPGNCRWNTPKKF